MSLPPPFTKEQIKQLAECERKMDAGHPFVWYTGDRIMCRPECMAQFGLVSGQTITSVIFYEMLKWNIADIEAEIDERKLNEGKTP